MYLIVTGAAGFIGSNIVKGLNARGRTNIIAVDHLERGDKFKNLVDCEIAEYLERDEFLDRLLSGHYEGDIVGILHQGACSDTMEHNGRYMMQNNYRYSITLLDYCQEQDIPLIYASSAAVYGSSTSFREERSCEAPLNIYGYSKFLFDQYVRGLWADRTAQIAGFRYFNVYGPGEAHKGRMASTAWHFLNQYRADGKVKLFMGSGGFGPGEQRRDFVHVDDVVKVNLFFLDHPDKSGIFNVGTGAAQSFNEVAVATVHGANRMHGRPLPTLAELQSSGIIEYIDFPAALVGKYQSFTQADISRLRAAGYRETFLSVEEGVGRYVEAVAPSPGEPSHG